MSADYPRFEAKAGRFNYDQSTKKVKVGKEKGLLAFYTNADGQNHVSWVNMDAKTQEIDLIVFPFDAKFERIASQNNTYLLKFDSNDDRYFFYLQEKIDPEQFVNKAKERISFVPPEPMEVEIEKQEIPQKIEEELPVRPQAKGNNDALPNDFIARLTSNLMAAKKGQSSGITNLSKVLTPEAITSLLGQLAEDEKMSMLQFLPEQQRQVNHIGPNLRSPQFQQAVEVLSDALNSENVLPLFMEMGLDQKHLKKNFGVHAFLLALQEWAEKQQKKEGHQKIEQQ